MMNESVEAFWTNSWAFALIAIAFLFVLIEVLWRKKFNAAVFFRVLWLTILGAIVADYNRVSSKNLSQPETLHILFDRSSSVLDLKDRHDKLEAFLQEIKAWTDERKQPVQILSFGDQVRAESFAAPKDAALKSFLRPAEEELKSEEGTVILLSDGRWTDSVQMKRPVYTIQLGEQDEKDVWIETLQPSFTAFLKNRLKIPVELGQRGFTGQSVRLSLWLGDEKIDEKELTLANGLTRTELTYFPERMGENIFVVRVSSLTGELSDLNNQSTSRVHTVRDKMRILHIGGKPSVDLKAWRLFLTRQPDVDLVSFYILRTINNVPEAKNSELSLIPFPYEELFSTELSRFDVVILQNFDFNLYFPPSYLSNLARFIREGGGLLIVGGDQGIHRYESSPLEPLFPFEYIQSGLFERESISAEVSNSHPMINGLEQAFQKIGWTGFHRLKHQNDSVDLVRFRNGTPLLSVRAVDRGRVVALNTDESWRLQMQPNAEVGGFGKLARRTLQYLTFDPEMEPQKLISGRWRVGHEVALKLANGEASDWTIRSLFDEKIEQKFQNQSEVRWTIPSAGPYWVKNSRLQDPVIFETEEQPWRDEWKHLLASDEKMLLVSRATQGKSFSYKDRKKIFDQPISGRQILSASIDPWLRNHPLFSWLVLSIALLLMGADFFLRKKSNWDA